jgi:NAD(P)H-hydrate epimerase
MSDTPIRLTRAQVREIDRRSIEEFHIPGIVLMENAARGAAEVAMKMLGTADTGVAIVCGSGNNGGDGFAVARHLHNAGVTVTIIEAAHDLKGDALIMSRIAEAMNIERIRRPDHRKYDLIVDAIFGTGLTRSPTGELATLIDWINRSMLSILAIDLPSGLDCDTGEPLDPCVRATQTVTFVAEKVGFANPASRQFTGKVTVADIGCPRELIEQIRT